MFGLKQMRQALALADFNMQKHFELLRLENVMALQNHCENKSVADFCGEFSFDKEIQLGEFSFYQTNCLKKNFSWNEQFIRAIKSRLLLIGSGIGGDYVAVDLLSFKTGIIFHDCFWDDESEDLRKFLVNMECSVGGFYLNSVQIPDYPIDAYEAAAYMNSPFTGYSDVS